MTVIQVHWREATAAQLPRGWTPGHLLPSTAAERTRDVEVNVSIGCPNGGRLTCPKCHGGYLWIPLVQAHSRQKVITKAQRYGKTR